MKQIALSVLIISGLLISSVPSISQQLTSETFSGLKFRNIGPAFTSGRIADIAIHPVRENTWYVAVGSGGVWKTVNSGTTWTPVFDSQKSYSIGCVTLDPSNPATIWVGTGENVGGRHVAFGDGVYVSHDEGQTWENTGLQSSEHISKIVVHPKDPNTVWVAAQGPLWSSGGDRGVYKTTDGGKTWRKTLGVDEWTGATDLIIDPRDPKTIYAATWQRHRTVAAYLGGGPGSGIYRSTDGGESWEKLKTGLPTEKLGKIGLAISPFDPDMIYAAIEMEQLKGGIFISYNKGSSWTKQSNTVSGGTGPHYYQELYASPHHEGKLFLMNNYVKISDDHGKTFYTMNEEKKHVDSHAMAFKMSDPDYLLFGTDGGLYESFDLAATWKFYSNLPVIQYYKVAVDDSAPFYNIYGGTQDNGSHGGPSRTDREKGILNEDWWTTLGADGHQSATEPGNPDITYGEFQQGYLWRIDQTTGERVWIQPQPAEGTAPERYNWDAPILVSPHDPKRLYFASQRVWRSDNRGDKWDPISTDLTRNQERLALPIMGRVQSFNNAWDVGAMSNYNTITSLAESPKQEGLIYAGTDDGLIQVTEDGGTNWKKVELGTIKGVPGTAFVNDVRADLFDANIVYAALDNHKYGDFRPYLLKSTNRGRSWSLMNGDLPDTLLTWRLVQDHVKKDLLFAATEFGVYFTANGGANWIKLTGGMPTIAIRDITIQRRENDLVAASFGRGFFVLDDISPLREFTNDVASKEATLYAARKAYWYTPRLDRYAQGHEEYVAENPPYGAVFTYYLADKYKTKKEGRLESEKILEETESNIPFPGWETLETEGRQSDPMVLLTIKDSAGKIVRHVAGTNVKGFNRVAWDLRYADRSGVSLGSGFDDDNPLGGGVRATPGSYTASLSKYIDGVLTQLAGPIEFEVVRLKEGALKGASYDEINAYRERYQGFQQEYKATNTYLGQQMDLNDAMIRAAQMAPALDGELLKKLHGSKQDLLDLRKTMSGDEARGIVGERGPLTPGGGFTAGSSPLNTTYGPTENHKAILGRAEKQLDEITEALKNTAAELEDLKKQLQETGAPWVEGSPIPRGKN